MISAFITFLFVGWLINIVWLIIVTIINVIYAIITRDWDNELIEYNKLIG